MGLNILNKGSTPQDYPVGDYIRIGGNSPLNRIAQVIDREEYERLNKEPIFDSSELKSCEKITYLPLIIEKPAFPLHPG